MQIIEALRYLHEYAEILHNDIKCNNVLLAEADSSDGSWLPIVLINGKASLISENRRLRLDFVEQYEYVRKYPHIYIAPAVVEEEHPYSA